MPHASSKPTGNKTAAGCSALRIKGCLPDGRYVRSGSCLQQAACVLDLGRACYMLHRQPPTELHYHAVGASLHVVEVLRHALRGIKQCRASISHSILGLPAGAAIIQPGAQMPANCLRLPAYPRTASPTLLLGADASKHMAAARQSPCWPPRD